MGTVSVGRLLIEGSLPDGENPLPVFRNPEYDLKVTVRDGFPEKYAKLLGHATGFRMLPYAKQDRYSRDRKPLELKTIVLENEFLRAEFLPEYGARLTSLVSKKDGRELLYRNPVFQPANLAIRNAWFSGGIEWNIGQYGHAFTTCAPVFCSAQKDSDGDDFLRVYEYERCKGLLWHIDFHLPEHSTLLYAHVSVHNPDKTEKSMYYWTNIAVSQTKDSRVFSASSDVVYIDPYPEAGTRRFGFGQLPELELLKGVDATYPSRSTYANEYFFACDGVRKPWEAAVDKNGNGLFEASTDCLKYRKMFCWGSMPGSPRWAEFLSKTGENYFEIQAGLAPTQLHGILMPGETSWNWTQAFGGIELDPLIAHDANWNRARLLVGDEVERRVTDKKMYEMHDRFEFAAKLPTGELLHSGAGWGALERERLKKGGQKDFPAVYTFPAESMDEAQKPWLALLNDGLLPPKDPKDVPWSFIVQKEWALLVEKNVNAGSREQTWNAFLHLGVIAMEWGESAKACQFWKASLAIRENAWAYRNLACAKKSEGKNDDAIELYRKAASAPGFFTDRAIAEEYLTILVESGRFAKAAELYEGLSAEWKRDSDVLAMQYGFLCAKTGDISGAEEILRRDFANIREGETPLSDIWFEVQALKISRDRKVPLDDSLRAHVRETHMPPRELDFRLS